jgi:PAS domain S-box-containing protein
MLFATQGAIAIRNARLYESARREIAERKRAEEALRGSESLYRNLFDRVPVGLYRTTPNGTITDANPALAQMLGYPEVESLLQASAASIHTDAEQRQREQALLERDGIVRDFELRLRRCDGTVIRVQDSVRAVCDEAGNVLYYEGSLVDVTARKQAEEEREGLIGELQEALSQVRTLGGLLPICASCKKIRDDQGYWRQVEEYVREHSEAEFTHSICPDCARKLYPDIFTEGN